ncbi:MAG: hypothetical protein ACREOF_15175 [Gemmatimonadales bacterium]
MTANHRPRRVRSPIADLHPGQLFLTWIGLAFAWVLLAGAGLASLDYATRIQNRADQAERDRAARTPDNLNRIRDSLTKLERADTPLYEIEDYLVRREGLQPTAFAPPSRSELRRGTAARFVAYFAGSMLFVVPILGFVITWVWFGGRRAP